MPCGIWLESRHWQALWYFDCQLKGAAMIFRLPGAALVLAAVGCAWQMSHVFIAPAAAQLRRSHRMFQQPRQLVERQAEPETKESIDASADPVSFKDPFVGGKDLEEGTIVGWELDGFTRFIHAAIYMGRGTTDLERITGVKHLNPNKHYIIEVSGPDRSSSSLGFRIGKKSNGWGGQSLCLTEMNSSTDWQVYDIISDDYGRPFSGPKTKSRAVHQLLANETFTYDIFWNNCQHFAVWAKYDKPLMLLSEEKMETGLRQILCGSLLFSAARADNAFWATAALWFMLANFLTAKGGYTKTRKINWTISTAGQVSQVNRIAEDLGRRQVIVALQTILPQLAIRSTREVLAIEKAAAEEAARKRAAEAVAAEQAARKRALEEARTRALEARTEALEARKRVLEEALTEKIWESRTNIPLADAALGPIMGSVFATAWCINDLIYLLSN